MDGGILHQLRNLINRVNVSRKELKHQVNEVEDFLELVTECHLVSAAMHFFGMKSVDDSLSRSVLSDEINHLPLYQRKELFCWQDGCNCWWVCGSARVFFSAWAHSQHFGCKFVDQPSCSTNSARACLWPMHSWGSLSSTFAIIIFISDKATYSAAPDGVLNYASAVLYDGLLLLEFKDTIRGDGIRILRCWKVLLMYYHNANYTNYASEAFQFIAQATATASPCVATQLLYGVEWSTQRERKVTMSQWACIWSISIELSKNILQESELTSHRTQLFSVYSHFMGWWQ